ncbi:MAG: PucR family transcriptional regulator [Frankiales bacterium]|nr:PucR family transcriptional regulator [Frankiales bacterium]
MNRSDTSKIDVQAGPQELDLADPPSFDHLYLLDPQDPTGQLPAGALVLTIGLDASSLPGLIEAAAASEPKPVTRSRTTSATAGESRAAVAGFVLRRPAPAVVRTVEAAVRRTGVPVWWAPAGLSWHDIHLELARHVEAAAAPVLGSAGDPGDLAELAQTIATLTGGLVTIEDTAARVLAYSRSSDDVDELRRLSILGRRGPAAHLQLLREWGVYERLATPDDVVEIAEHPESGVRHRLAVGVFAGRRQLGAIWVQQGATEFPAHARQALLGAARLTAEQLVRPDARAGRQSGEDLAELFAGRSAAIVRAVGRAADKPCVVAAIALDDHHPDALERDSSADGHAAAADPAAEHLRLAELAGIVSVHAAAFRRSAPWTVLDGRFYLLLPSTAAAPEAVPFLRTALAAVRLHVDAGATMGVGPAVISVTDASASRRGADLVLNAAHESVRDERDANGFEAGRTTGRLRTGSRLPADADEGLLLFDQQRPRLLNDLLEKTLRTRPDLQDPRLATLALDQPELARTLLRYLDCGTDALATAATLSVHVTTVRYRLRKVLALLGTDLDDSEVRLATQLQLRADLRISSHQG